MDRLEFVPSGNGFNVHCKDIPVGIMLAVHEYLADMDPEDGRK